MSKIFMKSKPPEYPNATLADFQANAGTGTFNWHPQELNDNNTSTAAGGNTVGQYVEVDFGKKVKIDQWRQYGTTTNKGDGAFKIQYRDESSAWVDWVTGIPTRDLGSWSSMSSETEVITDAIRLIITALDGYGNNYCHELEIYHS